MVDDNKNNGLDNDKPFLQDEAYGEHDYNHPNHPLHNQYSDEAIDNNDYDPYADNSPSDENWESVEWLQKQGFKPEDVNYQDEDPWTQEKYRRGGRALVAALKEQNKTPEERKQEFEAREAQEKAKYEDHKRNIMQEHIKKLEQIHSMGHPLTHDNTTLIRFTNKNDLDITEPTFFFVEGAKIPESMPKPKFKQVWNFEPSEAKMYDLSKDTFGLANKKFDELVSALQEQNYDGIQHLEHESPEIRYTVILFNDKALGYRYADFYHEHDDYIATSIHHSNEDMQYNSVGPENDYSNELPQGPVLGERRQQQSHANMKSHVGLHNAHEAYKNAKTISAEEFASPEYDYYRNNLNKFEYWETDKPIHPQCKSFPFYLAKSATGEDNGLPPMKPTPTERQGIVKIERPDHPIIGKRPHAIFSVENPRVEQVNKISHEDAIKHLTAKGYKVEPINGKYGSKERSLLVTNGDSNNNNHLNDPHFLLDFAKKAGQESAILSNGHAHEMFFLNHPKYEGKHAKGIGTDFHAQEPEDYYSTLQDGRHFTHGFSDTDKVFSNDTSLVLPAIQKKLESPTNNVSPKPLEIKEPSFNKK